MRKGKPQQVQVIPTGESVVQLATRVPQMVYRELKLYAVTENLPISRLVTEAIIDLLAKKGWKMTTTTKKAS